MALEAAVDGAARELRVEAAAHGLDDVVERQIEAGAQLDEHALLERAEADGEAMRGVRAIGDAGARYPAADGLLADAKLLRQPGDGGGAVLQALVLGVVVALACNLSSMTRGAP